MFRPLGESSFLIAGSGLAAAIAIRQAGFPSRLTLAHTHPALVPICRAEPDHVATLVSQAQRKVYKPFSFWCRLSGNNMSCFAPEKQFCEGGVVAAVR